MILEERPKGWRKGQTVFNFLWWLQWSKGYSMEVYAKDSRMADPFHIDDATFEKMYEEFLKHSDA